LSWKVRFQANSKSAVWEYVKHDCNGDGQITFDEEFHRSMSSVAIKNDLLIAVDQSGIVHCLEAKSGKVHWTLDTMAGVLGSPLIVADKVYVADEDGDVVIFALSSDPNFAMRKDGGVFVPLAGINMEGSIYSSPILANGTLYIATRNWLFAIQAGQTRADTSRPVAGFWPQWRGPKRDNVSTETGLLKEWPEGGPPLVWKVEGSSTDHLGRWASVRAVPRRKDLAHRGNSRGSPSHRHVSTAASHQ
jgi:outer membrane protein assembly factor BamB